MDAVPLPSSTGVTAGPGSTDNTAYRKLHIRLPAAASLTLAIAFLPHDAADPAPAEPPLAALATWPGDDLSATRPPAPAGLTATPGPGSITLAWTPVPGATGYNIRRTYTANRTPWTPIALATSGTTFTDTPATGLGLGTFHYTVSALNASGDESPASAAVNAAPLARPPLPAAPASLTAAPGGSSVTLNWAAVPGADCYDIKVALASGGPYTLLAVGLTATSYSHIGLAGDLAAYYYTVSARNASGGGPASPPANAAQPPPPVPASLAAPAGITAASGAANPDLYVADAQTHAILKITQADRQVTAFAGQPGTQGAADGAAHAALFRAPRGVTINAAGALVVADTGNSKLRAITGGAVATIAAAFNQPRAVAAHDTNGDTYVADTGNHVIKKLTATGSLATIAGSGLPGFANGTGAAAQFRSPSGVAVDIAGNLYIADTGNHAIRYIAASTGGVSTLAGQPGAPGSDDGAASIAKFRSPEGVAVDASGDVFVADTGNSLIREIHSGSVSTIAGGAPGFVDATGAAAKFNTPAALVLAEDNNLYVADTGNRAIRRVTPANVVTTLLLPGTPAPGTGNNNNNSGGGGGGGGGGAPTWWLAAALAALLARRKLAGTRR
jgi:sugar lactone lactonase YvrE